MLLYHLIKHARRIEKFLLADFLKSLRWATRELGLASVRAFIWTPCQTFVLTSILTAISLTLLAQIAFVSVASFGRNDPTSFFFTLILTLAFL